VAFDRVDTVVLSPRQRAALVGLDSYGIHKASLDHRIAFCRFSIMNKTQSQATEVDDQHRFPEANTGRRTSIPWHDV
jgi:hypothetical protein